MAGGGKESATGGPVTITYISSTILEKPEGLFEQEKIDAFNALNNGIQVKVEGVASNDLRTKYIALATSNQMPDFYLANQTDLVTLVEMGQAVDLSMVYDKAYLDGFNPIDREASSVNGVFYGIPYFGGAQGVIYRTDFFAAKGLTPPKTYDEFVSVAKALTGDNSYGVSLVGTKNSSGASRFQIVIRNFGIDEFVKGPDGKWTTDIGSQKYIDALRAFTNLAITDKVVPPGVIETGYPEAVALFSSGKAAMLITGSNAIGAITSQVPELKGKLGSFPFPGPVRNVYIAGGFSFFINPKSVHKKEAAEFIKYIISDENALEFSTLTGRLPTRTSVINNPKVTGMPELSGFLEAAKTPYVAPTIPGYGEINDIHGEAYQTVFAGQGTVETAAAKAKARAQAICDAANNL